MKLPQLRAAAIGLLLAGAAPVLAQNVTPPPAPAAPAAKQYGRGDRKGGGGMFAGLSDAGRATMRDAMRAGGDPRADHQAVKAARDRMLVLLDAETLDTAALKRAMDDERRAAQTSHEKRQAAMLNGFIKLSTADRKAFVTNARQMRARMEARVGAAHRGGHGGPGGDMPPPSIM